MKEWGRQVVSATGSYIHEFGCGFGGQRRREREQERARERESEVLLHVIYESGDTRICQNDD